MNQLAVCYISVGWLQEAAQLVEQVVEARKRVLGDERPDTLQSMNYLAGSYTRLADCPEAGSVGGAGRGDAQEGTW